MPIKSIMRYYYTPSRMVKFKSPTKPWVSKNVEQQEFSYIVGENVKLWDHFGRRSGNSL